MRKVLLILCISANYLAILPGCKSGKPDTEKETGMNDNAQAEIDDALAFELMITKDPATGKIPVNIRALELAQARSLQAANLTAGRIAVNSYTFQGPDNLGGRTRSVVFDTRYNGTTNNVVLAAGISGGVWKSTDGGATWVRKSPLNVHFSCTSIAQDTRTGQQDTWYYATGEAIGNSAGATGAFYTGNGVYKSTDNGETWSRLVNSNTSALETFSVAQDAITKLVVSPVDGAVYAAALCTIRKSPDGGATWSNVLNGTLANSGQVTDLAVTSTGRLYAGFAGSCGTAVDGVWTSTTGDLGGWTRIAGTGAPTTPTGWNTAATYGRLVLAITPGNENIVYALYAKTTIGTCASSPAPEAEFFKLTLNPGVDTTWTDLSLNLPDEAGCLSGNDPFAVQGGYDLVIGIHPTNPNLILLGGTNAYRSTDGFTSTTNTLRIGGYASPASYAQYTNSHPDVHVFTFIPNTANALLCGNDGGIQRTEDVTAAPVAWTVTSNGLRTYQYYYVAIDPRTGNNKVIGGAQDNGTTRNIGGTGVNFENVFGGDGVSVGLSNVLSGNTFEFVGSQSGNISRRTSTSLPGFSTNIRPSAATAAGLFVTLFHLDPDNTQNLYYVNSNTIYRTTSSNTVTPATWTTLTGVTGSVPSNISISALATTRGAYSPVSNLYFGTSGAKVFRLTDPANALATDVPVDISAGLPAAGYVSSISVNPRNDDTVLVTYSNYGVSSVFWTGNAKSATPTWVNVEGGLTLPSYRSSAIAIIGLQAEYFVGTSTGLYKAVINGASGGTTAWVQEGANEIGNAVVPDLKLRTIDNNLLAGTHGYGMWKTVLDPTILPVIISRFSGVAEKNYNTLTWTVESEINSKGYHIERKYKGQFQFSTIGFVASGGTGNNLSAVYNYKDFVTDFSIDQTFYRLRQEDKDGKIKYSSIVNLERKPSGKLVEYISANKSQLLIKLNSSNATNLSLCITDMTGRKLLKQSVNAGALQISIAHLPSGTYLAEIISGTESVYVQKFIK